MSFKISDEELQALEKATANVNAKLNYASPECPSGSCGNNCSGTCAWSPCTNVAAATSK